jgi:hypothetical protein
MNIAYRRLRKCLRSSTEGNIPASFGTPYFNSYSPASWKNRRDYHYDRPGSVTAVTLDKPGAAGETYA